MRINEFYFKDKNVLVIGDSFEEREKTINEIISNLSIEGCSSNDIGISGFSDIYKIKNERKYIKFHPFEISSNVLIGRFIEGCVINNRLLLLTNIFGISSRKIMNPVFRENMDIVILFRVKDQKMIREIYNVYFREVLFEDFYNKINECDIILYEKCNKKLFKVENNEISKGWNNIEI